MTRAWSAAGRPAHTSPGAACGVTVLAGYVMLRPPVGRLASWGPTWGAFDRLARRQTALGERLACKAGRARTRTEARLRAPERDMTTRARPSCRRTAHPTG